MYKQKSILSTSRESTQSHIHLKALTLGFTIASAVGLSATPIGDTLSSWKTRTELPGCVSMVWDGSKLYTDTFGYADLETKTPMPENALFWAASNGKAIACALVLTYVAEGKLNLDDPVEKYLPAWANIKVNGQPLQTKPTVRQLMGHRSGLPFFPEMPISRYPMLLLAQKAVNTGLVYQPGTSYRYSNWGIDCAVAICEVIDGEPWDELLKKRVLKPLDMKDATFFPDKKCTYLAARGTPQDHIKKSNDKLHAKECLNNDKPLLASSYHFDKDGTPRKQTVDQLTYPYNKSPVYAEAGGGLFCTAQDMCNFYRMIATRGIAPNGKRFLPENLMQEWYGVNGSNYTFGTTANYKTGAIGHGGAYATTADANWRNGTVRIYFTQCAGGNAATHQRRQQWEQATSPYLNTPSQKLEGNQQPSR